MRLIEGYKDFRLTKEGLVVKELELGIGCRENQIKNDSTN